MKFRCSYFTHNDAISPLSTILLLMETERCSLIFYSRCENMKRGQTRANRFLLPSPPPPSPPPPSFLPSPRVITDKRLKRELSATNIDCEDGKRRGRETESASCPATTRHDPLVRVAGKATISFQRRRAHASKGSSYVSIANELMGNHR